MLAFDLTLAHPISMQVSLDVPGVTALVGPNGAGKTTLLRALTGATPSEGTARCGDQVWQDLGHRLSPGARRIGFMPQRGGLFPHLSARQNAAFGLGGGREALARAQAQLERLGVADLAERRPSQLSGGESQRVSLARALCIDPTCLLLDEPLDALDAVSRSEVRALLAEHTQKTPTLWVSHDPRDIRALSDRVAVLENGRLVQEGPPEMLAASPATPYVRALLEPA